MTDVQKQVSVEIGPRFRSLDGWVAGLIKVIFILIPLAGIFFVLDAPSYLAWPVLMEQYFGLFLGLILTCVFILVPATKSQSRSKVPWYDFVLAALGLSVGLYVLILYPRILWAMGTITTDRVVMSTIAIVTILEAVRRMTGWILPCIGLFFIVYARFTWLFPGLLEGPGAPWDQVLNYLFLDTNGVLGAAMKVTAVIVITYILFGNMLSAVGAGDFFSNLALALFGQFRGGPAKMSVVGSSLFGTISGSAVSNVVIDGWITIPLMKKTGYPAPIAGAIEAVASTGGQIMPPIMGAAAFIIPEYTGVPYSRVALAAIIPAVLYYLSIFFQIHLEAVKGNMKGIPRDQLPRLREVFRGSYLVIVPLIALVYALFILSLSPEKAALVSALSIIASSLFQPKTRFRGGWIVEALKKTGKDMLEVSVVVALSGIIIGVINQSGLGFTFPLYFGHLAGGNTFVLLIIVALVCMILGMGMPTVAVYILLAALMGPSLIQFGIVPLAAHFFILYFGILSMITPPVCFAVYAAAPIAGADVMSTGWAAVKLAVIAYVVPFIFVYHPALLGIGSVGEVTLAVATAVFGCFLLSGGTVGYLFANRLGFLTRAVLILAGVGLLLPISSGRYFIATLLSNVLGGAFGILLIGWDWWSRERAR
jgi:TRAP transporter 4TM/12TM fusion protein